MTGTSRSKWLLLVFAFGFIGHGDDSFLFAIDFRDNFCTLGSESSLAQ